MPVVFFCILIFVIKQKKVVIGDGDVFPDVLLGRECGSGDNDVFILESNLYGGDVPYCLDFDVLDGVIGFYKSINFKAECGEKDYDGIVCDVAFLLLILFFN